MTIIAALVVLLSSMHACLGQCVICKLTDHMLQMRLQLRCYNTHACADIAIELKVSMVSACCSCVQMMHMVILLQMACDDHVSSLSHGTTHI